MGINSFMCWSLFKWLNFGNCNVYIRLLKWRQWQCCGVMLEALFHFPRSIYLDLKFFLQGGAHFIGLQLILHKNLFILQKVGELYAILLQGNKVWKITSMLGGETVRNFVRVSQGLGGPSLFRQWLAFSKASLLLGSGCVYEWEIGQNLQNNTVCISLLIHRSPPICHQNNPKPKSHPSDLFICYSPGSIHCLINMQKSSPITYHFLPWNILLALCLSNLILH